MRFSGICIITPDVPRLRDFYCALLGVDAQGDQEAVGPRENRDSEIGSREVERTGDTQVIIRVVVVLPAPLGPRKPKHSPSWTSKSIPSTAVRSP